MDGIFLEVIDLNHLHYALFNPHISQALRDDADAMNQLRFTLEQTHLPTTTKTIVQDIIARANGWILAENLVYHGVGAETTIVNSQAFVSWLLDYLRIPNALPSLLLNLIHLASASQCSFTLTPMLLAEHPISLGESLVYLRAMQGVAAVVVVLCWALYDQNTALAYRILVVLDSWNSFDYSEVHLLESFVF